MRATELSSAHGVNICCQRDDSMENLPKQEIPTGWSRGGENRGAVLASELTGEVVSLELDLRPVVSRAQS
jgi:hypothetical protein